MNGRARTRTTPAPGPSREPPASTSTSERSDAAAEVQGTPGSAALAGMLEDGDFRIRLGPGFTLEADELAAGPRVDLTFEGRRARAIPGLVLRSARVRLSRDEVRSVRLRAGLDVPMVNDVEGDLVVNVDAEGRARMRADVATTRIGALENPRLEVRLDDAGELAGSLRVGRSNVTPPGLGDRLDVTLEGGAHLARGRLAGELRAGLTYDRLGNGALTLRFTEAGRLAGEGHLALTTPFADGARVDIGVSAAGDLTGAAEIPAASVAPPMRGLEVPAGTIRLGYDNSGVSGALEGVVLRYPGLGEARIEEARIARGMFTGSGTIGVDIAGVADAEGSWRFRRGRLTGHVTLTAQHFPDALPLERGSSITARLGENGTLAFSGRLRVSLGPAGTGELEAAYGEDGRVTIGATVELTVRGLERAQFTIGWTEGALAGEADVPIDTAMLPGLSGDVHVAYRENRWSGETELRYEADDGKLRGGIRVTVRQTEAGALEVGGGGDVTARIAPRLEGTLRAEILPEGGVDVSGEITVTEPLELFPEWRDERELFRHSQNIPLWAVVVAVIRTRFGVRAGIGPGVFRDITVTGEYTIGEEGEPSLRISGEMYIPAFVEAYVAFGAGLGVDVALGSLTGGIEAVGSAGIYGAVSVVPELAYEEGDYLIEGTATLAAGARIKLGLNAWAEVEALWVTVWEEEWELAEWVWNVGPDLALQARMAYSFSNPAPPEVEFSTENIDTEELIQDAMPKDGPPSSGAREAVENRAEWRGPTREQGREGDRVPREMQNREREGERAPSAPRRPQRSRPPAEDGRAREGEGGPPQRRRGEGPPSPEEVRRRGRDRRPRQENAPGAAGAPRDAPKPGNARAEDVAAAGERTPRAERTIPESRAPESDQPRYPRPPSIRTLDEPPVALPRTRREQRQDGEAASRVVSRIEQQVDNTDALTAYFPRLKRRFGLSRVALVSQGDRGAVVEIEINPKWQNPVREKLRGRDLTRDDGLDLQTEVQFYTGTLASHTVGTRMVAELLGPDHPAGSAPSGQRPLMAKLASRTGDENLNYIRGHLLNDRLGGPGEARNLFPITQRANRLHERSIENQVKRWVNQERYWVAYTVDVDLSDHELSRSDPRRNYVTATFEAEASVLTTDRTKLLTRRVTIRSRSDLEAARNAEERTRPEVSGREAALGGEREPTTSVAVTGGGGRAEATRATAAERVALGGERPHAATAFDRGVEIARPTGRRRSYVAAPQIVSALAALAEAGKLDWRRIEAAMGRVGTIGPSHAALLRRLVTREGLLTNPRRDHAAALGRGERAALTRMNNLAAAIAGELRALL